MKKGLGYPSLGFVLCLALSVYFLPAPQQQHLQAEVAPVLSWARHQLHNLERVGLRFQVPSSVLPSFQHLQPTLQHLHSVLQQTANSLSQLVEQQLERGRALLQSQQQGETTGALTTTNEAAAATGGQQDTLNSSPQQAEETVAACKLSGKVCACVWICDQS